jgi:hypothetical protein
MERQVARNGRWCEGWLNMDTAIEFHESTRWDGRNHISLATGEQWEHELLCFTANGSWVIHRWSQMQGKQDVWETITEECAFAWLIAQDHCDEATESQVQRLPVDVKERLKLAVENSEI